MEQKSDKRARTSCLGGDDPVVTLNVRGRFTQTRRSTLTWGSRYFKNILDGPFHHTEGEMFVDCCPDIFEHVLYFFRHRKLKSSAPIAEIEDIAGMLSIDSLLEVISHQREIQNMVGIWYYRNADHDGSLQSTVKNFFTISANGEKLLFHEAVYIKSEGNKLRVFQGELKQAEDWGVLCAGSVGYYVQEDWGVVRFWQSGGHLLLASGPRHTDPNGLEPCNQAVRKLDL